MRTPSFRKGSVAEHGMIVGGRLPAGSPSATAPSWTGWHAAAKPARVAGLEVGLGGGRWLAAARQGARLDLGLVLAVDPGDRQPALG